MSQCQIFSMRLSHIPGRVAGTTVLALVIAMLGVRRLGAQSAVPPASPAARSAAAAPSARPSARPASQPLLDLAAAFQLARGSAPSLRIADARRDAAIGRAREGAQFPNPTVEWRRENLGSPLQPDIFATVYLPVDVTGRRLALRQAGTAGRDRAQADATVGRRDGELGIARAWLTAAAAAGALAATGRQFEALDEIAVVEATRLCEGQVAEAVALRTRLEADRARALWQAAQGDLARARAGLARTLGVDPAGLPPLAPLAAPTLPAAPDSAMMLAVALRNSPDVRAREAAAWEMASRLRAEQRGVIGDVQLQGGSKETGGFMTGQVGVAVPFPLFNRNGGARQRARGEYGEARALLDDARNAAQGGALAAWQAYQATRSSAASASTFVARGTEVSTIARVAYREGQATLVELLDAERAASDAMLAHLRWAAEAWLARLELERALGARLDAGSPLDLPLLSTLIPAGTP